MWNVGIRLYRCNTDDHYDPVQLIYHDKKSSCKFSYFSVLSQPLL